MDDLTARSNNQLKIKISQSVNTPQAAQSYFVSLVNFHVYKVVQQR